MEFVIMLVNFLCTAFEPFAPVFWHYVASIYPVCVYCATKFLQCGVVAFIIYLIVHIYRLERREERREDRRQERRNQTNTPAATITNTSEPILLLRAEIEKMQLHTRLLEAELEEVAIIFRSGESAAMVDKLLFEQETEKYEIVLTDHILRTQNNFQFRRQDMQDALIQTRFSLTLEQYAEREREFLLLRHEEQTLITQLRVDAEVSHDQRFHQHHVHMEGRKSHFERLVLRASETVLLTHTRRLETHSSDAESLASHVMRMRVTR